MTSHSSQSSSYDPYYDSPEFLEDLGNAVLPGDADYEEPKSEEIIRVQHSSVTQPSLKRPLNVEDDTEIYGEAHFGAFGEYMHRKRAKLQIQNVNVEKETNQIFRGLSIYINGYTQPSVQELRQLIIKHGGVFQAYLDKKSIVTHIITCSLTPAKIREFQHMKVVRPEWLIQSAKQDVLLPFQDFIFQTVERLDSAQGSVNTQANLLGHIKPLYAAHESNPNARKAMANPKWRDAHTSVAPTFIEGYYKNSRLHHLSTWKSELKNLVQEAQDRAERGVEGKTTAEYDLGSVSMRGAELVSKSPSKAKGKEREVPNDRVIMHCDFDCFFVSAGLTKRPELRGKPVVVCHSQGPQGGASSTSEIASSSYEARDFGIRNGMSLQQARQLCSEIITMPYEFELYKQFSLKFYTILMSYADDLQAVSVDEALIDVSGAVKRFRQTSPSTDPIKDFSERLRDEIRKATGCEASVGISHNILLARAATRYAKPAGSFYLRSENAAQFMAKLDIADLHGFGYSAKHKALEKLGSTKLGDLVSKSKSLLCDALGRALGETLYNAIRGVDDKALESDKPRKSVSCEINYGIRFENEKQAEQFILQMASEVKKRLNDIQMTGRSITLKVMTRDPTAPIEPPKFLGHGACDTFNKQMPLMGYGGRPTSDDKVIGAQAWKILQSFHFDPKELRGLGIQIQKLEPASKTVAVQGGGQRKLPFKRIPKSVQPKIARQLIPEVNDRAPEPGISDLLLPSFSQVDMTVLKALPRNVRKELKAEYSRRKSNSPRIPHQSAGAANKGVRRIPRIRRRFVRIRLRHGVRGISRILPAKKASRGLKLRRIRENPTPYRSAGIRGRGSLSAGPSARREWDLKENPFTVYKGVSSLRATDANLRRLGIDPVVFAALPKSIQREQMIRARLLRDRGSIPDVEPEHKVFKPPIRDPGAIPRLPNPKARYMTTAILRQQGKTKGEKLYFTETDDIQSLIEKWVNRHRNRPPNEKDVAFFSKFLVQCIDGTLSSDCGVEKAVAIMRWWQVLLRRIWNYLEVPDELGIDPDDTIGAAWWDTFRTVKSNLDVVARKKFGGKLSLK